MQCPHCQAQNPDTASNCYQCGNALHHQADTPEKTTVEISPLAEKEGAIAPKISPPHRRGFIQFHEGSRFKSLLAGAAIAAAVLGLAGLAGMIPGLQGLREFFWGRGFIQYLIIILGSWAFALIFFKRREVGWQEDSFRNITVPRDLSNPEALPGILNHLRQRRDRLEQSWLYRRLETAFAHVRARGRDEGLRETLQEHSDRDVQAVDSGYTLLRVLIAVIPLLGFCGTVLGISNAVGYFSGVIQGAKELEEVITLLGGVTTGLAVAFDTTLLSLLITIPLLMFTSTLKKREDDLLTRIDEFCSLELVERLQSSASPEQYIPQLLNVQDEKSLEKLAETLSGTTRTLHKLAEQFTDYRQALKESFTEFQTLEKSLAEIAVRQEKGLQHLETARAVAVNLEQVAQRIAAMPEIFREVVAASLLKMETRQAEQLQSLISALQKNDRQLTTAMSGLELRLAQEVQQMANTLQTGDRQVVEVLTQYLDLERYSNGSLAEHLAAIRSGLDRLYEPLESLNKPVTVTLSRTAQT